MAAVKANEAVPVVIGSSDSNEGSPVSHSLGYAVMAKRSAAVRLIVGGVGFACVVIYLEGFDGYERADVVGTTSRFGRLLEPFAPYWHYVFTGVVLVGSSYLALTGLRCRPPRPLVEVDGDFVTVAAIWATKKLPRQSVVQVAYQVRSTSIDRVFIVTAEGRHSPAMAPDGLTARQMAEHIAAAVPCPVVDTS